MGRSWLLAVEGPPAPRYLVQKALREYLLLLKPRGLAVLELHHHERNLLRLALQSANAPAGYPRYTPLTSTACQLSRSPSSIAATISASGSNSKRSDRALRPSTRSMASAPSGSISVTASTFSAATPMLCAQKREKPTHTPNAVRASSRSQRSKSSGSRPPYFSNFQSRYSISPTMAGCSSAPSGFAASGAGHPGGRPAWPASPHA